MEPVPRQVVVYVDAKGRAPAREWLRGLRDPTARGAVLARIRRLGLGNTGDTKPVGTGVHELRIHLGGGLRLYYAMDGLTLVVLLCGGGKRTQARDIARAKRLWAHYQQERTHEPTHSV